MACLDVLSNLIPRPAFVVGSGSLPSGVPDDFYARVARIAKGLGAKMVLDTSGPALKHALDEGVYLVKPNLGELRGLLGGSLADETARAAAACGLVQTGAAELVALSLGDEGALLATSAEAYRALPLKVELASAVGAGDSFLGGMVWALAEGKPAIEAFGYGVAAATAAVLNEGTELCHADDVHRLYAQVRIEPIADRSAATPPATAVSA
jgi:6-phosphofructokinase 2